MRDLVAGAEFGPVDGHNYTHHWSAGPLAACLRSDVGKRRKNNEDSCILCVPEDKDLREAKGLLFAVADGMGGATAGEYASRMALNVLTAVYYESEGDSVPDALKHAVEQANLEVFEESEVNPVLSGMGTTVSAIVLWGEWVYIAQVGDSRVYQCRNGQGLTQLTRDHSLVAEQVRNGMITEEEAESHSLKNLITRAVGIKTMVEVDLFAVHVAEGDTLLICSDGLSNMVSDAAIEETLALPDLVKATESLIENALESGGTDNVTAVTLRLSGAPAEGQLQASDAVEIIEPPKRGFWHAFRRFLLG